ncbi:MAG: nitronate monooxygenase [SAR202 cluster bacterium]|nr:2-nitropropane dioxygenase [Chloroflexota bacterium]MQG57300.1 nitronate monooxygenase [SAR202 cluster bacterium]MQG70131.1 nitronate monooxygenase [SAR202 cluster bacterium]|tara:strand:+ start:1654 stop:2793 length:1140 start_codon:yes stop_codon:yes gene_type:complete
MARPVLRTDLCDILGIEYPICMAGMGGLRGRYTPPELVAAVSEAGGLGVVGGAGIPPEDLRKAIQRIKELTDKPFGVDLLLPANVGKIDRSSSDEPPRDALRRTYPQHVAFVETLIGEFGLDEHRTQRPIRDDGQGVVRKQVDVIMEENVPVFAAGLGDPAWVVPIAREAGAKVMGLVGNVRNAMRQVKADVDVVVAQGTEAGGHTGKIATMPLVPQIRDAVAPLPVVAAGGIANGTGIAAALTLGAAGVWMGTAFLTAAESGLYGKQIDSILGARSDEFVISRSYTGKTARQYKNPIVEAWENSGLEPLPMPLQGMLMADFSAAAERAGRHDLVFTPSGQAAGLLSESKPAAQIMKELVVEAVSVLEAMPGRVTTSAG